jgi:hypothetical protein
MEPRYNDQFELKMILILLKFGIGCLASFVFPSCLFVFMGLIFLFKPEHIRKGFVLGVRLHPSSPILPISLSWAFISCSGEKIPDRVSVHLPLRPCRNSSDFGLSLQIHHWCRSAKMNNIRFLILFIFNCRLLVNPRLRIL